MMCVNNVGVYSRKIFIGGLPLNVTEADLRLNFQSFGEMVVEWDSRATEAALKRNFRPSQQPNKRKGYVFLVFKQEQSVHLLISKCYRHGDSYFMLINTATIQQKPVQVRPWRIADKDYIPDPKCPVNPRHTVFLGALPRTVKAAELAQIMQSQFGTVCFASVDVDAELHYSKGAARVTFCTYKSYIAAMVARFVSVPNAEDIKRVEIKPYIVDGQPCDNCHGQIHHVPATFFCHEITCLQYYCDPCWRIIHFSPWSTPERQLHTSFLPMGKRNLELQVPSNRYKPPQTFATGMSMSAMGMVTGTNWQQPQMPGTSGTFFG